MKSPLTLEDAQQIKDVIVTPLVESVEAHLKPLIDAVTQRLDQHSIDRAADRNDVNTLKANQRKALMGWGVLCLAVTSAVSALGGWIRARLHWG